MACCFSVETSSLARPTPAHLAQQVRKVHARGAVALPDIQLHNSIGEGVDSVADASIGEDGVQGDVQLKVQSNQTHTLGERQGREQECFESHARARQLWGVGSTWCTPNATTGKAALCLLMHKMAVENCVVRLQSLSPCRPSPPSTPKQWRKTPTLQQLWPKHTCLLPTGLHLGPPTASMAAMHSYRHQARVSAAGADHGLVASSRARQRCSTTSKLDSGFLRMSCPWFCVGVGHQTMSE